MKKKVLFLTRKLQEYRIPILELIAKEEGVDLTVAHSGKSICTGREGFAEVILTEKSLMGFSIHTPSLYSWCNQFDVVVAMLYLKRLSFIELAIRKSRRFGLIYWGIGVRASQNSQYDSPSIFNAARFFFAKRADALIFYSDRPIKKYLARGFSAEELFVMNNTVSVLEGYSDIQNVKNSILFVGTLKSSKKIFELLEAYQQASSITELPRLEIVGGGEDVDGVKEWIAERELSSSIEVLGPIYDERKLAQLFQRAHVCVSPGQAGLSVLKSFGYGVPFVTRSDAMTGGERFNIVHEKNGILVDDRDQLRDVIVDVALNPAKYKRMGDEARRFYVENRRPDQMARGFMDAVGHVLERKAKERSSLG